MALMVSVSSSGISTDTLYFSAMMDTGSQSGEIRKPCVYTLITLVLFSISTTRPSIISLNSFFASATFIAGLLFEFGTRVGLPGGL